MRLLKLAALVAAFVFLVPVIAAHAHSWYSGKKDPVYGGSCCGGTDCATWTILPGELSAEEDGIRVRLPQERAKLINPYSQQPIDALVKWDRVQPSEDGNWHLCLMTFSRAGERGGIYCLFMPPNG
jgi:hypothetical protein